MLSVFAAPGNLPEIHELEALITHVALSPLVCSQAPQERLLATSLLHLSRIARAEQIMILRPFHRAWRLPLDRPTGAGPVHPSPSLAVAEQTLDPCRWAVECRLSLLLMPCLAVSAIQTHVLTSTLALVLHSDGFAPLLTFLLTVTHFHRIGFANFYFSGVCRQMSPGLGP